MKKKFKIKADVYQQVTDRIIAGLEAKGLKWFRPWDAGMGEPPINNATGKPYKGINVMFLSIEQIEKDYEFSEWLTYKQAATKGGNVIKGETGTGIVFWNINFHDPETNKYYRKFEQVPPDAQGRVRKIFSPRIWNVFNIAQCEGIEAVREKVVPVGNFSPIERAELVYSTQYPAEFRPTLELGGASAFYVPSRHHVQMPKPETFVTGDDYYKTLFHELVHSTGHETILNRLVKLAAFGSEDYSKEELVAEIGAQFLVGLTGIKPKDDHANSQAYINNWVKKLKEAPKMALSAATQAMKAVDYITGAEA